MLANKDVAMPKRKQPPQEYFPADARYTTAGPEFAKIFTDDIRLVEKVHGVLLIREGERLIARIFRDSHSSPGSLSCDKYVLEKGATQRSKDQRKYLKFSDPPSGAIEAEINGVKCWTMHPLTDEEKRWLRSDAAKSTNGTNDKIA